MMRQIQGLAGLLLALLVACSGQNEAPPAQPMLPLGTVSISTPTLAVPPGIATADAGNSDAGNPDIVSADAAVTAAATAAATDPLIATQAPTRTPPPPDSGWEQLHPGLERRILYIIADAGQIVDRIYLLRIEPAEYEFQVAYHAGEPQSLLNWQRETGALVVLNGGYFNESYEATALVISEGETSGISYGDFAGMFAVSAAGPEIRWLQQQPHDPNEPLLAGLQSFPLLIKPGGLLGFPEETGRHAQRTVVAQDRAGRMLFLVTSGLSFTLHELAKFLVASDLDLEVALNLDGGPSTGLILSDPEESVSPQANVPAVILVRPKP